VVVSSGRLYCCGVFLGYSARLANDAWGVRGLDRLFLIGFRQLGASKNVL